jgi:hypothetical protein
MKKSTRILVGFIMQLVAVLFSLASWIDPLEGGLAMFIGIGLTVASVIVSRVRIPKFTWITALVGIGFLVTFWALYIAEIPADPAQQMTFTPSDLIMSLLTVYTVLAVAFICSTVFYAIHLFTAMRASKTAGDN